MIRTLELKNFRRHEDLLVTFSNGLNVLRGANEAGKSTTIEGALYALYGAKALRDSLGETVTWGKSEKDLSARLEIEVNGVVYTFSRSKAGAECNWSGGKVTGQAEVTNYAAELLGADAKTAALLMLASQSGLHGALDDGPVAVSALMSKLANFDLIDSILEAAASRLLLGAATPIQQKLAQAETELQAAREAMPPADAMAEVDRAAAGLQATILFLEKSEAEKLQPALLEADRAVEAGKVAIASRTAAARAVTEAEGKLTTEHMRLDAALVEMGKRPDGALIEEIRTEIAGAESHQKRVDAYKSFQAMPAYPEVFWDEPKASFEAALAAERGARDAAAARRTAIAAEIKALARGIITSGKCPTCGHAAMSDEHVRQKNAEINDAVATLNGELAQIDAALKQHAATLQAYEGIEKEAGWRTVAYAKLAEHITVDESVYPPKAAWVGEPPAATVNLAKLRAALRDLEAQERAAAQAEGRATTHRTAITDLEKVLQSAKDYFAGLPEVDLVPLATAYDAAYAAYSANAADLREHRAKLAECQQRKATHELRVAAVEQRIRDLQARIAEHAEDLKKLEFNNGLVAKLKKLKPAITDHLWNTVLAAVGNFFSTLRGEQSVVSKDTSGFRVNGKSVESLSGSTIDVLALAIRVALSKTFIPHASFMVLDEPAHGCDETRTANVLGFLSSVGFKQTILASHDELSESVADNVIALGA